MVNSRFSSRVGGFVPKAPQPARRTGNPRAAVKARIRVFIDWFFFVLCFDERATTAGADDLIWISIERQLVFFEIIDQIADFLPAVLIDPRSVKTRHAGSPPQQQEPNQASDHIR